MERVLFLDMFYFPKCRNLDLVFMNQSNIISCICVFQNNNIHMHHINAHLFMIKFTPN